MPVSPWNLNECEIAETILSTPGRRGYGCSGGLAQDVPSQAAPRIGILFSDYTFFSFTTLTVGHGNMVPVGGVRGLALLEAVIGAM
jgi:Ion channel